MAFQPFQLPSRPVGFDAMDNLGDTFIQLAQMKRQKEQQAIENLRNAGQQKRLDAQDFQADYLKANQLAQAGDMAGAQSIMAKYGAQAQQREAFDQGPPMAPQAPPNPMQGQAPSQALEQLTDPNAIAEQTAAEDFTKPQNPLVAAAQASQERQKRMAQMLTGQRDGQQWSIDPEAQRQQRGQRLDQAFGASEDPITKELYPQMRPALLASDQGVDSTDVLKYIQGEKGIRRQEAAAGERERMALAREDRRNAEWDRRFPMQEAGRDRRAAQTVGLRGAAVEQGAQRIELSTEAAAREATNKVFGNLGFKEIQVGNRKFNDMAANLSSAPNAALDAVTAGTFVKMAQGGTGVISDSDMRVFWERIGGFGLKAEAAWQAFVDGTLPADKRAIVLQSVKELARTAQHNLANVQKSLEFQFDNSPTLKPYKDQMVGTYFPQYRERAQKGKGTSGMSKWDAMMESK